MKSAINSVFKRSRAFGILVFFALFSIGFSQIPPELRGGIQADSATIQKALDMKAQGWIYIMPEPKSAQAAWGNRDGRTTWWIGYWENGITNETSSTEPTLQNGKYTGDGQGGRAWHRGGSPSAPSKLEWLLSTRGGIPPRD